MTKLAYLPADRRLWETNSVDCYNPEFWARTALMLLYENMVMPYLVNVDYSDELKDEGDIVNTRQPAQFVAVNKTENDDVTVQNATAVNVPIPLDQHPHTSFRLRDSQISKGLSTIMTDFVEPAIVSITQRLDLMLLGQCYQFLSNQTGTLGGLTSSNAVETILGARKVLNDSKVRIGDRKLILNSSAETLVLANPTFHQADRVGDEGTALREASLGRKLGFDTYMCQNMAEVLAAALETKAGAVNNAAGYPVGTTTLTVDTWLAGEVVAGEFCKIGDHVHVITSVTGSPATSITITPGLVAAVADDAVITNYHGSNLVNGAQSAGYSKAIAIDGGGANQGPQVGQAITFGTDYSNIYCVTSVNANPVTSITLDRPLAAGIADDAAINLGPAGGYNFGFIREAIALVSRPLAQPDPGMARSYVVNFGGIAIRVTITYSGEKQGTLFTFDILCGLKVLNSAMGVLMLS